MSTIGRSDNPSILIVADVVQPPFSDAVAVLRQSGLAVAVAADVYTATAELALSSAFRHVLIDVRNLDPQERSFLQLAPRYFRGVRLCVADLPGASSRLRLDESPLPLKTVPSFISAVMAQRDEPVLDLDVPAEPMQSSAPTPAPSPPSAAPPPRPAPRAPLSTDGATIPGDGPSLHEAVRRRMASDEPAPPQRKPPVRTPPKTAPTISPQELDALLTPDESIIPPSNPGDGNTGRPR